MSSAASSRRQLGRSGVMVTPLTLGAANFGSQWDRYWTLEKGTAERLVARAFEHGVAAIDTANVYNNGESEIWVGEMLSRLQLRGRISVSTKFGYRSSARDAESGGSGRAPMRRAVETSLRRLGVEAIDLLYLHLWDRRTPVEETLEAAGDLIQSGHIRAFGLSNVPAWYVARATLLCEANGLPEIAALQLNYNMLTRHLEWDFGDLLKCASLDLIAWGPLANGLLSGRYEIDLDARIVNGSGRLTGADFTTGAVDPLAPEVSRVLAELKSVANEAGRTPAQVALMWLMSRRWQASVVIGVSSEAQLAEQLAVCDSELDAEFVARLDAASAPTVAYPQNFLMPEIQVLVHGRDA